MAPRSASTVDPYAAADIRAESIQDGLGPNAARNPGLTVSWNQKEEAHGHTQSTCGTHDRDSANHGSGVKEPQQPHVLARDAALMMDLARWIGSTWPVRFAARIGFWIAVALLVAGFLMAFGIWLFRNGAGTMLQFGAAIFALIGRVSALQPGADGSADAASTAITVTTLGSHPTTPAFSLSTASGDPTSALLPAMTPVMDGGSVAGARYLQDKAQNLVSASLELPAVAALAAKIFGDNQKLGDHQIFAKDWVAAANEAADVAEQILYDLYVQLRRETAELPFLTQTAQAISDEATRIRDEDQQGNDSGQKAGVGSSSASPAWTASPRLERLSRGTEYALDITLALFSDSIAARKKFVEAGDDFSQKLLSALEPGGVVGTPDAVFAKAIANLDREFVAAGAGLGWEWGKRDVQGRIRQSGEGGGYTFPLFDFSQVLTCQEDAKWAEELHMAHIASKMCAESFRKAQAKLRRYRKGITADIKWLGEKRGILETQRRHLSHVLFISSIIPIADTVGNQTAEFDHRIRSEYFQSKAAASF